MMWTHYCIVDRAWISVGKNEPCNWCGEKEPHNAENNHHNQPSDLKWNPEHLSLKHSTG